MISLIFAEYINRIFWHTTRSEVSPDDIPDWAIKLTAIGAVLAVTLLCIWTRKLGARVAVVFTTAKVSIKLPNARIFVLETTFSSGSCFSTLWCKWYIHVVAELNMQISITALGIIQLARGRAAESFTKPWFEGSSKSPSAYSLALYSGLWAFDGWDQANYVGGEMHNPQKNIPRTIHSSMAIVTVCKEFYLRPSLIDLVACLGLISAGQCLLLRGFR